MQRPTRQLNVKRTRPYIGGMRCCLRSPRRTFERFLWGTMAALLWLVCAAQSALLHSNTPIIFAACVTLIFYPIAKAGE